MLFSPECQFHSEHLLILTGYCHYYLRRQMKFVYLYPLLTQLLLEKWPSFCRWQFTKWIFHDRQKCISTRNYLRFVPKGPIDTTGSSNGLASNRRQSIAWMIADPVQRRIYAALRQSQCIRNGAAVLGWNRIHYIICINSTTVLLGGGGWKWRHLLEIFLHKITESQHNHTYVYNNHWTFKRTNILWWINSTTTRAPFTNMD